MADQIASKMQQLGAFFQTIWGVLTIAGTIIGGLIGGYYWLHDTIVERNAQIISKVSIEQIRAEVDPMPKALYMNLRQRDSVERLNLEFIALEFMNRQDSMAMIMVREMKARQALVDQVNRIEAKIDASRVATKEDKLERIWEYLKTKEKQDSTDAKLNEMMIEIKSLNKEKINSIRSGDRIR